jgi:hypothetical protein
MQLRHLVIATCCVVVQLAAPAPAQAWWEWIDQLSGPGPFTGWDFQWRMVCIPETRPGAINISLDGITTGKQRLARAFGAGCLFDKDINPMGSLNFAFGQVYSVRNELDYGPGVKKPHVTMTKFEPSLSMFADASKRIEITSGLGVLVIHGSGFDTFTHYYWSPLRVTLNVGKGVGVRLGFVIMPKGFDDIDFGARRGTFHTDKEVLGTASLSVDLARLFKDLQ